jgi:glucan-binding YG repeat protein
VIAALGRPTNGFTYTGNELDGLLGSGEWYEVTDDSLAVGDVLWRRGHTGMVQWYGGEWCQSEFLHGDYAGGLDGETGDQDGTEAVVREYRDWDWYTHLRYCGPEREPLVTGWIEKDGRWWYRRADGSYPTGWALIDGSWYLFDGDGWMLTGWQCWDNLWYYLNPKSDGGKGKMLTGWLKDNLDWYWLNAEGASVTGWHKVDGAWHHFESDGKLSHNAFVRGEQGWYALDKDGKMVTDATLTVGKDGVIKL